MTNPIEIGDLPVTATEGQASASAKTATVPPALQSLPRWAIIGIFLLLLMGGIAAARNFLIPVVLGFLLALVFTPVRRFVERCGLAPSWSAFLIVGTLVAVLSAGVLVLAEPVGKWLDDAPKIGRQVEKKVKSLLGSAQAVVEAGEQVDKIAKSGQEKNVREVVVREPGVFGNLASVTPAILAQAVFGLVLLLFLLSSGDMFYEKIVHVMPTFKDKRRAVNIVYDIENKLSRYLFTITAINAGLGASIGVSMWLIGVPNPLLFGAIGFAFNYVPYLGAISGIVIATIVGLVTFEGAAHAFLPAAVYFALTAIEGQFVTPYFVGRRLEMNSVVIFLSIALGAWLWSVMGMLLAVPLLVTIRAFCEHIPQLQPVGDFLSARGREGDNREDTAIPSLP
jgi:predicted PurR-regulated permease PerM